MMWTCRENACAHPNWSKGTIFSMSLHCADNSAVMWSWRDRSAYLWTFSLAAWWVNAWMYCFHRFSVNNYVKQEKMTWQFKKVIRFPRIHEAALYWVRPLVHQDQYYSVSTNQTDSSSLASESGRCLSHHLVLLIGDARVWTWGLLQAKQML